MSKMSRESKNCDDMSILFDTLPALDRQNW